MSKININSLSCDVIVIKRAHKTNNKAKGVKYAQHNLINEQTKMVLIDEILNNLNKNQRWNKRSLVNRIPSKNVKKNKDKMLK